MFVPQERPLDRGEVRVTEIEGGSAPRAVRGQGFQWGVPPEGVTGDSRDWETGGGVEEVIEQTLTWGVNWLSSIVKCYFARTRGISSRLKSNFIFNKSLSDRETKKV